MKAQDLRKGQKVWCWWLSRTLYYRGQNTRTLEFRFEDVCDVPFYFTEEQIEKLREEA